MQPPDKAAVDGSGAARQARPSNRWGETILPLLETIVIVAAVLALTGLNWLLGRSGALARERGAAAVRLREDLIDFVELDGEDANGGRARLALGTRIDDLAVAVALGDSWVTRRLRPGSLRQVSRRGATVAVRARDFTLPALVLTFDDADRAALWEGRLAPLVITGGPEASVTNAAPPIGGVDGTA